MTIAHMQDYPRDLAASIRKQLEQLWAQDGRKDERTDDVRHEPDNTPPVAA